MDLSDLTLVVPCYNEALCIGEVVKELIEFCERRKCFLVVVNDGSTDASGKILAKFTSPVLRIATHKKNRGYGGAIKTGISVAHTQYVITLDADGQHSIEDVEKLHKAALSEDADLVVGERNTDSDRSLYRQFGKFLIRKLISSQITLPVRDINSGMKLYSRKIALKLFPLCPDNMAYSDIILMLFSCFACKIVSVPIHVRERRGGSSTINTCTAIYTFFELCLLISLFSPFLFFAKIAMFFALLGCVWAVRCYLLNFSFSIGSSALFIISAILLFNGLILEQICRYRKQNIRLANYKIEG